MRSKILFPAPLLLLMWSAPAWSQAVNATLLGTVTDASGAAVPAAKVVITEVNTRVGHTGATNPSGNYEFPNLPPGLYRVAVEMEGFKKEVREDIHVEVDTHMRVDVQLQPGAVNETIEVTGAPPPLQTDRADTGRVIDEAVIEEMPLGVNRNFQSLLDLVPGTTPASFQHSQFFNASSSLQTESNGQPRMGNNLQIEGIDNNQRTGLLQMLIPPAEAVQSVSISTSNHDPELGRASGAVTNVILKSGTNNYHGGVYWTDQNSAFDARSFFNPEVGHLAYNYVGGNIGGPIRHNRIFFFTDYLRTMDRENNANTVTLPSMAYHSGDLSAGTNHVYDPLTGTVNVTNVTNRVPFPGNIIPPSRIDPIAAKILTYLPAPNLRDINPAIPSNNYFALLPAQKTNDQMDVKIDNNLTDKDRLSGRFSFSDPHIYQGSIFGNAGGPAQGAFQGSGWQRTYSAGLNYNRTVNPTLLTEIRVGVAHYHNEAVQTDYGKNDSAALGIPGINVNQFTSGLVGVNITDLSKPLVGYAAALPWIRAEANIDVVNSWTKIFHNHSFKWGVDIRRIRDDLLQDQTYSPRGVMDFEGANPTFSSGASGGTGVANYFAAFLLDVPDTVARDLNTYFPALRAWQVFSYVADNWQISPSTTINLGLRWELYPGPTPAFPGGFSNYDYYNNQLVIAGVGGNPLNMGMQTRYKNFAPRIGVARRLTNSTVIRAGFGLSYTPFPDNTWAYNYPVRANNTYQNTANSYLPATLPDGSTASFERGFPVLVPIPIPSNGIITNPDPTSTYYSIPLNWKNPYVETWNAAVQQALPGHFVLDVAYVANHGVDTPVQFNLNAGQIVGLGNKGQPQYPRTAPSYLYFAAFSSSFNSLQVKFDRRFTTGLKVTTSFTWGKSLNYQKSDDGQPDWYYGLARSYGRADYDRTLNLVQSYIYEFPFGHGKRWLSSGFAGRIVGNWRVSGIWQGRTGTPLTITTNNNNPNIANFTQTPNLAAPIHVLHGINVGNPWLDISSFAQPKGTAIGTMGRGVISGPDMFVVNLALARTMHVRERYVVDLRLESFNATNTPWFSNPDTQMGDSNFGLVTTTNGTGFGINGVGGGRSAQAALKVTF